MGWLFSSRWLERKDLVEHLVNGNGVKTLKHCCVGNNLWCVHEIEGRQYPIRFVTLYKMQGPTPRNSKYNGADHDWWGYKDVCETMGPTETSCPASYLRMCTAPESDYAYRWRQRVYALDAKKQHFKKGTTWKYGNKLYTIIKRLSPSIFLADGEDGYRWRIRTNQLLQAEMTS